MSKSSHPHDNLKHLVHSFYHLSKRPNPCSTNKPVNDVWAVARGAGCPGVLVAKR